jgi:hypothetical protein
MMLLQPHRLPVFLLLVSITFAVPMPIANPIPDSDLASRLSIISQQLGKFLTNNIPSRLVAGTTTTTSFSAKVTAKMVSSEP